MNNPPRKHHFVPQFWIKRFVAPDGTLMRLGSSKSFFMALSDYVPPLAVGWDRGFESGSLQRRVCEPSVPPLSPPTEKTELNEPGIAQQLVVTLRVRPNAKNFACFIPGRINRIMNAVIPAAVDRCSNTTGGMTGAILIARGEHDVSTVRRQLKGDLITDTAACTGDDRRASVEAGIIARAPIAFHPITP
jgi:hypothetical protein